MKYQKKQNEKYQNRINNDIKKTPKIKDISHKNKKKIFIKGIKKSIKIKIKQQKKPKNRR